MTMAKWQSRPLPTFSCTLPYYWNQLKTRTKMGVFQKFLRWVSQLRFEGLSMVEFVRTWSMGTIKADRPSVTVGFIQTSLPYRISSPLSTLNKSFVLRRYFLIYILTNIYLYVKKNIKGDSSDQIDWVWSF